MAYEGPHPFPVPSGGTGAVTLTGILTGHGIAAFTASTVTQHGVLVGGASNAVSSTAVGTTGQVLQANTGADPTYSTATYPSTITINQLLYSSAANTVTGLATVNNATLATSATGTPSLVSMAANGNLLIGSASGPPLATTLTAGTGIAITNAANSITIATTGSEVVWTDEGTNFNALSGNGYFVTATATATLPASPSQGNTIYFAVDSASGILTITANTGQTIRVGSAISASAGTCASNKNGDSITLVYRSSDTTWISIGSPQGTWTIT